MTMAKQYTVTGACVAHIPVDGPDGRMLAMFYAGAVLPEGVPEGRIQHLLDAGLIAETGQVSEEEASARLTGEPVPTTVNGRSSKSDLIEHAVGKGLPREEAEGMSREQILDRYVRKGE
jgi:hypothetical protein